MPKAGVQLCGCAVIMFKYFRSPGYISFYQISYLWYSAFAVFVTTVCGLIVSFLTGKLLINFLNAWSIKFLNHLQFDRFLDHYFTEVTLANQTDQTVVSVCVSKYFRWTDDENEIWWTNSPLNLRCKPHSLTSYSCNSLVLEWQFGFRMTIETPRLKHTPSDIPADTGTFIITFPPTSGCVNCWSLEAISQLISQLTIVMHLL